VVRLPRLEPILEDDADAVAGKSPRLIARFSFNSSLRCFVEIGFLRGIFDPRLIGVQIASKCYYALDSTKFGIIILSKSK
jgi:hypothetical protein